MWQQTALHPPHVCTCCGRGGAEIGPFWHIATLNAPHGLDYERPVNIYACSHCFRVAACDPSGGPLPEFTPGTIDEELKILRQSQDLLRVVADDVAEARETIEHQQRVIDAYEEAEDQTTPAEIDIDALAESLAQRLAAQAPPPVETPAGAADSPKPATRRRTKAAA